jgi:F-box protein 9
LYPSQAVEHERQGRLHDALTYYRAAFRADPNVDRAYHRLQITGPASSPASDKDPDPVDDLGFRFQKTVQLEPDYEEPAASKRPDDHHPSSTRKLLAPLLKSFRENPYVPPESTSDESVAPPEDQSSTPFLPLDPQLPFPFAILPDETLLHVLSWVLAPPRPLQHPDISSLERFSEVSRHARILTLDPTLWRKACSEIFVPPHQIREASSAESIVQRRHAGDWRRMWIEQCVLTAPRRNPLLFPCLNLIYSHHMRGRVRPRIRTDGVFISVVTYLRRSVVNLSLTPSVNSH